jgi:cell division protease FtsH
MAQNGNDRPDSNKRPKPFMNWRLLLPLLLVFFLVPSLINVFKGNNAAQEISYTRFKQLVSEGSVQRVVVQGEELTVTPLGGTSADNGLLGRSGYVTYVPTFGDPELLSFLRDNNVEVVTTPSDQPSFFGIVLSILPYVFLLWIFFALFKNIRGQGNSIFKVGENKAKLYDESKTRTTFADVAGLDGPKEEVMEIVEFLKDPTRYERLGARSPKGILLVGPPGTGKTLIARAIAGEAGVPFFSMSGSDFMEMFVGVGASRVRSLFQDAKKKAPSIIFIDELDSIGRHRGAGLGGGHDEREQTLNQMLNELDGFEQNSSTVVVAATNRPDILDPALLRPGRFDRQITVPMPSKDERAAILRVHAQKKPFDDSVDLDAVALRTIGFSGADLENLLNEAALRTARRKAAVISMPDIEDARDRIMMGLERKGIKVSAAERKLIAYHEAGHAVTAAALPNTDPVLKVTIIPRGMAMGVTMQEPAEERYVYPREYLQDRIAVMMGGRAAENLVFDSMTSGAENDLKQATQMARRMVTEWGMGDGLANTAMGESDRSVFLGEQLSHQRTYSESTARDIDEEVKTILRSAFDRTKKLLTDYRTALDTLAELLLAEEQVSGEKVKEIVAATAE